MVSHKPNDLQLLCDTFMEQGKRKVVIKTQVRDARARWLQLAKQTAESNLESFLSGKQTMAGRLEALRCELHLDMTPSRMECFDISHSSGEATVASCVVFDSNGARKADYRKFNIDGITSGDDYAAMQQALDVDIVGYPKARVLPTCCSSTAAKHGYHSAAGLEQLSSPP